MSDQRPGFRRGAESIVKNTLLEGHAHGDPPRRSDNETDGCGGGDSRRAMFTDTHAGAAILGLDDRFREKV